MLYDSLRDGGEGRCLVSFVSHLLTVSIVRQGRVILCKAQTNEDWTGFRMLPIEG
jgi:hypothetical protein